MAAAAEVGREQQDGIHIVDVEADDYSCCKVVVVEQAHRKSPQYRNQREVAAAGCHYYYTPGMIER
jgi:hypothetical protein